jgi:hypothetical protein
LLVLLTPILGSGCGDEGSSAAPAPSSKSPARATCPAAWAAGWQAWTNKVGAKVFCPSFLPSPITGEIDGQWNTAKAPGKTWQLGYAWLEHDDLVHVVFEGYPKKRWPPSCEGVPCFDDKVGTESINGHEVTWYDRNEASHSGHVAAVFRDGGYVYAVSMHVYRPYNSVKQVTGLVRKMVAGLVPLQPR